MPQATGALSKILAVEQAALRELPDPVDAEVLYVQSFEFDDNEPREQDPTLAGGYRGELKGERGRIDPSGTAVVTLGTSIAFWLKQLVGEPTTTGSGPYTHSFEVNPSKPIPPAFAVERDFSSRIATPGRYVRNKDIRVASAAFAFQTTSAYQQATFTLRGMTRRELPSAVLDGSPSDYGHAAFSLAGMSLQLDGGSTQVCVESLNLNWDNDLDPDLYCINDGGQRHDLPEGLALVTGEGVAQFDTPALLAKAQADASLALAIVLKRGTGAGTAGNEQLTITVPLSAIDAPTPGINGPRGLKQNFTFRAYRSAGSELGVKFELKCPRATI